MIPDSTDVISSPSTEKVVIPQIAQPAMLAAIHHSALLNLIIKIKHWNRPAETPLATPKAIEPNLSTPRLEAIAQPPMVDISHHSLETAPRLNRSNAMPWKISGKTRSIPREGLPMCRV
jgi:hypothetical protein